MPEFRNTPENWVQNPAGNDAVLAALSSPNATGLSPEQLRPLIERGDLWAQLNPEDGSLENWGANTTTGAQLLLQGQDWRRNVAVGGRNPTNDPMLNAWNMMTYLNIPFRDIQEGRVSPEQLGLTPEQFQQFIPVAAQLNEQRNAGNTAIRREGQRFNAASIATVLGGGLAANALMAGGAAGAAGSGATGGDLGMAGLYGAEGTPGMTAAEYAGLGGEGLGGLGSTSTVGSGGSVWDSIGKAISTGAKTLGSALTSGGAGNLGLGGLISSATNLYGANKTQDLLDEIRKGSDPFASQRANYFAPTAESAGLLGKSQDLAYRGLSDPTFWDQSWLNDAAERAGSDTQKKLASQGYNFSTNTINNMSKNMRDTRAQYIIPGQQNLINNIGAQGNATQTFGNLAGAQFNIGNAAPSLLQGQNLVNQGINNAAGNVAAGFNTSPANTTSSLANLWGQDTWGQGAGNGGSPSAWGDGNDPFTLGSW